MRLRWQQLSSPLRQQLSGAFLRRLGEARIRDMTLFFAAAATADWDWAADREMKQAVFSTLLAHLRDPVVPRRKPAPVDAPTYQELLVPKVFFTFGRQSLLWPQLPRDLQMELMEKVVRLASHWNRELLLQLLVG